MPTPASIKQNRVGLMPALTYFEGRQGKLIDFNLSLLCG